MVSASSNAMSLPGYWDFMDRASIDFCEPNYTYTPYVAEVLNTVSSLWIAYVGVAGLARTYSKPMCSECKYERAVYYSLYFNTLCVGLGSCCLHATLSLPGQAADEVPMVLANVFVVAFLVEHKSKPNEIKHPNMPLYCIFGVIFCTLWYLRFQHNYFAFLGLYVGGIVFIIGWLVKLCFFKRADAWEEKQRPKMIKCFAMAMGSYAVLGFGAWVMDMLMCEFILSQWTVLQMLLHPVWHIGAGLGTHLAVCLATIIRCTALRKECEWASFMMIPFVEPCAATTPAKAKEAKTPARGRSKTPVKSKPATPPAKAKEAKTPARGRSKTPVKSKAATPPAKGRSSTPVRSADSPGLIKCRACGKAAMKGNYGFCLKCRTPGTPRAKAKKA